MEYRSLKSLFSLIKINYSYRLYSRNIVRRKTAKILNSPVTSIQQDNFNSNLLIKNVNNEPYNDVEIKPNTILQQYETLQNTDSQFTKALGLVHSRKLQERKGKMFLEGQRLINDAIEAGMKLHALYFCHEEDLTDIEYQITQNVKLFKVLMRNLQQLSSSTNCSGVVGLFQRPSVGYIKSPSKPVLPVTILCDNIRDPGNLGSIIRHSASTGCQNVLLLKGCVDPWETKVLKVGCGGHFRIPIINNLEIDHLSNYISQRSKIFIADNSSDIDNWEQTPELLNYDACPKEIEDGSEEKYYEPNHLIQTDESDMFESIDLPCYLYSSVIYPSENIVLYVGGETHGVDARILKLACSYGGKKVKIPLENSMDSLNSSFAVAIILYEIKRQLSEKLA